MTRADAGRPSWAKVLGYIIGGVWLFVGFAVLVSLPVAAVVGLWVLGRAALTYMGVI